LALAGSTAIAAEPGSLLGPYPGDMTVYETPAFTLVTIGNSQLRRDIPKLPRLRRAMEGALRVSAQPTGIPTYMYVVSTSMWNRYLAPSSQIISEFVPTRFANYVIAEASSINRVGLFHEYAHLFLYAQLPGAYPLWFDEGVAIEMSRAEFSGGTVRFYPSRIAPGHWIAIEQILRATKTSPEYLSGQESGSFHLQSRLMVHRALFEDPEYGKNVLSYLDALNQLQSIDEAARASFPVTLDELDGQMRAHIFGSKKHYAFLEIGKAPEVPLPAGRELPPAEALWGIATVALDTGLHLERVGELLDAAEKRAPKSPRTHLLRMRLAARQENDADLEDLYLAIQPQLTDAGLARAAGLAFVERTQYLQARPANETLKLRHLERSFELLDRSLNAHPDDPEAVWAFAMAAAGVKRGLETALQRLEPMFERLPRNPDLAQAAALVYEAGGSYDEMLPCLVAAFTFSHSYDQKRWASGRIAEVRAKLAASKASP
jgi:tetratricopeptide (TPR) repeat protein